MKCSDEEGFNLLSKWRTESQPVFVTFTVPSSDGEPVAGLTVEGLVLKLDSTGVIVGNEDAKLNLDLRGVTFVYGEPKEVERPGLRSQLEARWESALELRWPTGLHCLFLVHRP